MFNWFDEFKKWLAIGNKPQPKSPIQSPQPQSVPQQSTRRDINTVAINKGLNAGKSWEDISRDTGTDLSAVRLYSQQTRPDYGIQKDQNSLAATTLSAGKGLAGGVLNAVPKAFNSSFEFLGNVAKAAPDGSFLDKEGQGLIDRAKARQKDVDNLLENRFGLKRNEKDNKFAYDVGAGVGNLGADIAMTVAMPASKASKVGEVVGTAKRLSSGLGSGIVAANHGIQEANDQIDKARAYGIDDTRALATGVASGATQAAIEKIGMDKMFSPIKPLSRTMLARAGSRAASEGIEEGSQQFASNAFEKTYNANKNLMDDVAYSAAVGAAVGGPVSVVLDHTVPSKELTNATPNTSRIMPQNESERQVAINSGTITPETKKLSVEARLQTALNSDIGMTVAAANTTNQNTDTSMPTQQSQASTSTTAQAYKPLTQEQPYIAPPSINNQASDSLQPSQTVSQQPVDAQTRYRMAQEAQLINPYPQQSIDNNQQVITPNQTVQDQGSIAGALTNEYQRMFGQNAISIDTPTTLNNTSGVPTLGTTTISPNAESRIAIATNQANPTETLFHESVHKALADYMTAVERTVILQDYAAQNLIDPSMSQIQIEEKVAEDFIDYVASITKNTASPRITDRIAQVFRQVFERIRINLSQLIGTNNATPEYIQFYKDLYNGTFAGRTPIDPSLRNDTPETLALQEAITNQQRAYDTAADEPTRMEINKEIARLQQELNAKRPQSLQATRTDIRSRNDQSAEDAYIQDLIGRDITPEQFINDLVDQVYASQAQSQGTSVVGNEDAQYRISNNTPFYQEYYKQYKTKPSKDAIRDMVEQAVGAKDSTNASYNNLLTDNEVPQVDRRAYSELVKRNDAKDAIEQDIRSREPSWDAKHMQNRLSILDHADMLREGIKKRYGTLAANRFARYGKIVSKLERINNAVRKIVDKDGKASYVVDVKGGSREANVDVSTKASRTKQIYVKGSRSDSKVYDIPVSTRETRRVNINVKQPRSKLQEFVAVNADIDGKPIVELIPLDGTQHTLKNGTVVNKEGVSVGSYLGIDDKGDQYAYVEGKPVNIAGILGDIEAWGNLNMAAADMDRMIEKNAPDKETAQRVQKFLTQYKDAQEAYMKTELVKRRVDLQEKERSLFDNLPDASLKKDLAKDMFRLTERTVDENELKQKYGDQYVTEHMKPAVAWARQQFDDILATTNKVLIKNGFPEIPRRDDYITHIQEDPTFWQNVGIGITEINPFGSSVSSDINPNGTRGSIPTEIVGRTDNTSARRRWNPFAQQRRGSQTKQDFFASIDSYFEPMLFNKYLTPAASRARVTERAFRTYEKAKQIKLDELAEVVGMDEAKKLEPTGKANHPAYDKSRASQLVIAFQEYGNALAGKTNYVDRGILDRGGVLGQKALKISTKAQQITGASAIPGSISAATAQILSIPQTIARDNPLSVIKAAKDMLSLSTRRSKDDPMRKSAFMRVRYTDASTKRKTFMQKYTGVASIPLEKIEREASELSWRSAYHQALKDGYEGQKAIDRADVETKKTLAGRGIGDRPFLMNSKALGIFTQFGLEVNNMRLQFWNDFTVKQKIKFMVAASALNFVYSAATGSTPLPDYIKSITDSLSDFGDDSDDEKDDDVKNIMQAFQRLIGETSKFVPGASTIAGVVFDDTTKEQIFGKNSDMSRFGTPAASRVATGAMDIVGSGGNTQKMFEGLTALTPTGGQIRKTVTGTQAMNTGYIENSRGNIQNVVDKNDPASWIKAILFGKGAIPGQQEAYNTGYKLGKEESGLFKEMFKINPEAAKDYFNTTIDVKKMKERSGTLTDVGETVKASALSGGPVFMATKVQAEIKQGMASGKMVNKDGIIYNKNGEIYRSLYKDSLKDIGNNTSEAVYNTYLLAYGLEGDNKATPSTGSSTLDKLVSTDKAKKATSPASKAIALYKGESKYKDVPTWVKDRFYSNNKFNKSDIEYGVISTSSTGAKVEAYYRPIAEGSDHQKLLDTLYSHRKISIDGKTMGANDAVITQLQKEGYLTKTEAKALRSIKIDKDGKEIKEDTSGSSGKRQTKKHEKAISDAINGYVKAGANSNNSDIIAAMFGKYRSPQNMSVVRRSPAMRRMKNNGQGGSKNIKTALG